ncbi:hypothetical protein N431DRAFT_245632 [Stipitochalara longipes BDJ]|nr:hypothetical protein N431DRAFT_245632 [Stipitochalara longipes BDJ]
MSDTSIPRRPPKVGHKKSRTGCQRCRERRVKCNEVHPKCASCDRHQTPCIYDRGYVTPTEPVESRETTMTGPNGVSVVAPTSLGTSLPVYDLPETRHRRLLELRLLHQWVTKTALSLNTEAALGEALSKEERDNWIDDQSNIAFANDSALYMLYSVSALHLARYEPHNFELQEAYRQYFAIGLRKHSVDVSDLSKANADVVCMTSSLIRVSASPSHQERNLDPYTPPTQWIQLSRGAGRSFKAAIDLFGDDERSLSLHARIYKRIRGSSDWGSLFVESNRQGLLHLLRPARDPTAEPWDSKIEQAYKSTLSLIGSVQLAIAQSERQVDILRRLLVFPMLLEKPFIDLVEEGQPRALVLIAYYFAMLTTFSHVWWIGETGKREIKGIQSIISAEWSDLMTWPLTMVQEGYIRS